MGAYHGAEQPLLFGTYGNYRGPPSQQEIAVSQAMQDEWRAFANDPLRGLGTQLWPQFSLGHNVVRTFGKGTAIAENLVDVLKQYEDQC